jgi:hypothetical protein
MVLNQEKMYIHNHTSLALGRGLRREDATEHYKDHADSTPVSHH